MKEKGSGGKSIVLDLISERSDQIADKVVPIRRRLDSIPGPAFKEYRTQKAIVSILSRLGLKHRKVNWSTGVVGLIDRNGRRTIALRADMDALPIAEEAQCEWKSTHPGFMLAADMMHIWQWWLEQEWF